jgi:sugar O-acyltransferase (sialic acid O-acetyltransferase NeuD family)
MKKVGLIGFGALGRQIRGFIEDHTEEDVEFVIFDDVLNNEDPSQAYPFNGYREYKSEEIAYLVCIGYHHLELKKKIISELQELNKELLTFVHPTAFVNKSAKIGKGVVIYPMCNIDRNCVLEEGVLVNNSCVVSHDTTIKNSSYLGVGVIISGQVEVGECSFLGSGVSTTNGIRIGEKCVVGVGSVLTKDIPGGTTGIGNPFKIINIRLI